MTSGVPRAGQATKPPTVRCSFCGLTRTGLEVVRGPSPGLFICRDCAQLCVEILHTFDSPRGQKP
jgi:hypothetical protein